MFDYEKSSGVDITSKENYFFSPPRRLQGGKSRKNPCFFSPPRPERISDPSGWRWRLEYF